RDPGIGIPETDLPHVFDRFYRGANVAGRFAGTGLGLAGARQIVEQHGGAISVESREGIGTTFTVRLPLSWTGATTGRRAAPIACRLCRRVGRARRRRARVEDTVHRVGLPCDREQVLARYAAVDEVGALAGDLTRRPERHPVDLAGRALGADLVFAVAAPADRQALRPP